MGRFSKHILVCIIVGLFLGVYILNASRSMFVDYSASSEASLAGEAADSTDKPRYPVARTAPQTYEDVAKKHPIDLRSPENIKTEVEYDPLQNRYLLKTKVGDMEIVTPFSMTSEEYRDYSAKQSLNAYFRQKNMETEQEEAKGGKQFSPFDMQFDLGPATKIFGPGGVQLQTQGTAEIKLGIKHSSTGNPSLPERARNRTFFDFDSQINLNVNAKVGDKVNFGMNYNTDATFGFDSQKLKLAYQGKEDEIVKILEAGNVSMNTSNSLIRGGAALFGIKTELQFGKLRVGAILSQQESESKTVSSRGGVQTTPFDIPVDQYDENRHFFFAHYFRDTYDSAMSTLPYIKSGITINRVEVWVTNKRGKYDEARNIVAFSDLGENDSIRTPGVNPNGSLDLPYNDANDLYGKLNSPAFAGARDINTVTQTLTGPGYVGGEDYEKIESARKLDPSEYVFNKQLGYISLKTMLQTDEVLAVAFEYTYREKVYQVGEFSTDNPTNTTNNIYLKLLKGSANTPASIYWDLMMKNIYSLNAYSIQSDKFRMDIMYQSDTTGTYMNYITEGDIANKNLLQVMNLDRLDSRQNPYSDGFFDFVEGYTIFAQNGKIIFPVVEPFGSHLADEINNPAIAKRYAFQELYDSTSTVAKQIAERNKFRLVGEYKASSGSEIQLGAMNVARGSVRVTANGALLAENVDYSVDYNMGTVTILNQGLLDSNTPISVSLENQSNYGMQRKTMMGLDLNYEFSKDFNMGATIMHMRETPLTTKTNIGEESVRNTLWGLNTSFRSESQWLTNLVDKIPLIDLTAPSQVNFNAEFAHMIPGHYESQYGGKYSYVDDFENTKMWYDLRSPYAWFLSGTPIIFPESSLVNDIEYGKNRALLAWYQIDGLFTRQNSSLTPEHIKNDKEQLSNHYVREVTEYELFPNKEQAYGEPVTVPVFNMAFYPQERGPYNVVADFNTDGTLTNPQSRWGGIYRKMDNPDFESSNVEYVEFWLMDPFIYNKTSGGDLYINLGEISEDVLKDERKFAESAMPINGDTTQLENTIWGKVPKRQTLVYAFDNSPGARKYQDVGLKGLRNEQEFEHPTYYNYVDGLKSGPMLAPQTKIDWESDPFSPFHDPAGDNYHYFRGSDYDREQRSILSRYKRYNGLEGNSADSEDSPEKYPTSYKLTPDVEDINQDFTMNENEKYFQYKIRIHPDSLVEGKGYIVNAHTADVTLRNGNTEQVTWYQFKVPIRTGASVGGIKDFKSIRFMRMYMTNFTDSIILRFGTLELVRGEWRIYAQDLFDPNRPPAVDASLSVAAVNIEENSDRKPVSYVLPPGVTRVLDPSQPQIRQENEQSLSLRVDNLAQGDARAVYKNTNLDMRQYKRIQMFSHAEQLIGDPTGLHNNEMSVFIRLGSDYRNNYYEYEIPLKLTPSGTYNTYNGNDQATVWPTDNMFDFSFEILTNLKLERNREKRKGGSTVTFMTPYSSYDPNRPLNKITIVGNPSLAEVKTIMIGVRNNSTDIKSATVWVNELRLTEFNEDGGWAANANLNVALSDLGNMNLNGRMETAGFGGLDQGVMERSIDDYYQYNVSTTVELGKLFPKDKVTAPLYYAYGEQITSPKYNPLDQDILLKDALDNVETSAEKDSIKSFSQTKVTTRSFNLSNIKVNVTSKNPMPWDPSNFSMAYSYSESFLQNPTTEYERNTDRRGSLSYTYSPYVKPWQPFGNTKSKSASSKFAKEFAIGYLPSTLVFQTDMSRAYYEMQLRDLNSMTATNQVPVSFRQEFYWNRDFSMSWNLTKNLIFNIRTGTEALIEEPHYQVNKSLNPDKYQVWKDSVWQSIRELGTPLKYGQRFDATYNVPLKLIPVLDWTTLSATYGATYNWDRGAVLSNAADEIGNTIRNQRKIGFVGGMQLLTLYNKSAFLKKANQKFVMKPVSSNTQRKTPQAASPPKKPEPRKFERDIHLNTDSATVITHNLKNKKVNVSAKDKDGKRYDVSFKAINENQIRINNKDTANLKLTIIQGPDPEENTLYKVAQVAARGLMMVRTVNVTYNLTDEMALPGFRPDVGPALGQQGTSFGYAPGVDFAFGLTDRGYIDRAQNNGWLIGDSTSNNINPAIMGRTEDLSIKATLEPIPGLKIGLQATRMSTSTTNIQFMYAGMPEQYGGTFMMTTIAIGSSLESPKSENGYSSASFDKFLSNRAIIANRLQQQYNGSKYPSTGFFSDMPAIAGQNYADDPSHQSVNANSGDVLIPAFLSAYTGKDPNKVDISAFPSLRSLLPNWDIRYEGLIQLGLINKYFKSFILNHRYDCRYNVGSFSSFLNWVQAPDGDGLGFVKDILTNNPSPSSPYDISLVSITELFSPLIGLDATFKNNMTFRMEMKNTRNINLNVTSYQIVESKTNEAVIGIGYKLTEFNKVLKLKSTGAKNFSNDLTMRADFAYRKMQSLIRKIEDGFTQPTSGTVTTTIKLSADYNLSKALTLRAFFDKDINKPLVSSSSYPISNSNFGISVRLNLTR